MKASASALDEDGLIESFVYTDDEKKTIVDAFEAYANLLYSFNSNLNTKVSNVQSMIGSLDKCRPEEKILRFNIETHESLQIFLIHILFLLMPLCIKDNVQ